jgi:type II secretory pathway predicted ATPase ExeA
MYESYWGLREMPFENTPDPRFLYRSVQHEEALARMLYAIQYKKGRAYLPVFLVVARRLLLGLF